MDSKSPITPLMATIFFYLISVLTMGFIFKPDIAWDYARVGTLSLALVSFVLTVVIAAMYQRAYKCAKPQMKRVMLRPYQVWAMGAAFGILLIANAERTIELFGEDPQWNAMPPLFLSTVAAFVFLVPLFYRERVRMTHEGRYEVES